ncbi:MAG: hypothetical protein NZ570_00250, partial [Candidatus Caldarchaeum sp.]|nr:hypothetical protein [Candidatus Caldarchaeum sp.]
MNGLCKKPVKASGRFSSPLETKACGNQKNHENPKARRKKTHRPYRSRTTKVRPRTPTAYSSST